MLDETPFGAYFSHSWRPRDVELNLLAWAEISGACELLVDVPDEPGADPPYYINRIEELLRRSDLFFCVLTHRVESDQASGIDDALQASVYAAFEIRLAERFGMPRLILYERATGFIAPPSPGPEGVYIPFDRGQSDPAPDRRQWVGIARKIRHWLEWAAQHLRPASYEQANFAVSLYPPDLPDAAAVGSTIESALNRAGYEKVALHAAFRSNTKLFQVLHGAGLVVADLAHGHPLAAELYAAAHALGVPAIRMMRRQEGPAMELPWLLRGHPGGYPRDLVEWRQPEDLPEAIERHARAMFRISHALGDEASRQYFHSKRYSQFLVFLSHTLKPPHRELVEQIHQLLGQQYVTSFEYHLTNAAGEDWKKALRVTLSKTTHFVLLLTDGYEQSVVCTYEIEEILKRGDSVQILPFMAAGRSVPHPKLGPLHHRLLSSSEAADNAAVVVKEVMETLGRAGP